MKKKLFVFLALIGLFVFQCHAGLLPDTIALNYIRPQSSQYVNTNVYLAGSTITFTNCKASLSGTLIYGTSNVIAGPVTNLVWYTNDTRVAQDLTGLVVYLKLGNSKTNFNVVATNDVNTNGTFFVTTALPTAEQLQLSDTIPGNLRIQCTLSNTTGGLTYTYRGDQYLFIRTPLQY